MTLDATAEWLGRLAADLARDHGRVPLSPNAPVVCRQLPSGAGLAFVGGVVVKLHHPRTDAAALATRLATVTQGAGAHLWVQPLEDRPRRTPDGRAVTLWPRVEVVAPTDSDLPWAESGRLLAALHSIASDARGEAAGPAPEHGGRERVARALSRVATLDRSSAPMLTRLGRRLLDEVAHPPGGRTLVHGDWHLGQLARTGDGLRLLDVDDLGVGDPAWDLGRPAGFWAVGALDDSDWQTFLTAYRIGGGPGVPADGDPWPRLDLPARCAVFVAAVRSLTIQPTHSADPADALLEACARM